MLSPYNLNFLVNNNIIEEHIAGIPGDIFIKDLPNCNNSEKAQIAKEYVNSMKEV